MNMRLLSFALIACGFSAYVPGAGSGVACAQVTLLGPGTIAYGVSADGGVVVGSSPAGAFSWTASGGRVTIPATDAFAVSGDGGTIVGSTVGVPYRWRNPGGPVQRFDVPTPLTSGRALGASGDGGVIVGYATNNSGSVREAFRWTAATGAQRIPTAGLSQAVGVSRDGGTVVGEVFGGAFVSRPFTYTTGAGLVPLPILTGSFETHATAINFDGSIVVGWGDMGALSWRNSVLSPIAAAGMFFRPQCVNDDGSVIAGVASLDGGQPDQAAIWTPERGAELLTSYMGSLGISFPQGYFPRNALGISADGRTIVGQCVFPQVAAQGFVVTIPSPASTSLVLVLFVVTARRRAASGQSFPSCPSCPD